MARLTILGPPNPAANPNLFVPLELGGTAERPDFGNPEAPITISSLFPRPPAISGRGTRPVVREGQQQFPFQSGGAGAPNPAANPELFLPPEFGGTQEPLSFQRFKPFSRLRPLLEPPDQPPFHLSPGRTEASGGSFHFPGLGGFGLPEGGIGTTFDDPATRFFENFINFRLNELIQPIVNPHQQQLSRDLQTRIGQLREPPFTTAEESALRTSSIDEIERQRQAARRNLLERTSARGFLPTSGLVEEGERDIGDRFGGLRAQESAQFGQLRVTEQQRRLDQAINLANALAVVEAQVRAEEEARRQEMLTLASLGAELPERRLQLALTTLQGTPPPSSLFSSVAALQALNQQQSQLDLQSQAINQSANTAFGQGLAGLLAALQSGGLGGGGGAMAPPAAAQSGILPGLFDATQGIFGQGLGSPGIGLSFGV